MNLRHIRLDQIGVIIRKELLETIRESKILLTGVILPLVIYPLLIFGISTFQNFQAEKLKHKEYRVGIDGDREELDVFLKDATNRFNFLETDNVYRLIREQAVDFGIEILTGRHANTLQFWMIFSGSNEDSMLGQHALVDLINKNRSEWIREELIRLGIPEASTSPVTITVRDLSTPETRSGFSLGKIIPFLLIMILVGGCSYTAIDLIAGEKERGCFETLLVSSVKREEVIFGKFSIVLIAGIVSVILNLTSMYITMKLGLFRPADPTVETGFQIDPGTILLVFVCLLPVAVLFSALLIQFATRAKSYQHGQIMLLPFSLGAILPCLVAFMPGLHSNSFLVAIPVANTVIVIKEIMEGKLHLPSFFLMNFANLIYSMVFLRMAVRALGEEESLVRVVQDGVSRFEMRRDPVRTGLIGFSIIWLMMYFVMAPFQAYMPVTGLLVTLWGLMLLSTWVLLRVLELPLRSTLRLNRPSVLSLLALVFALPGTMFAAMVIIRVQEIVMPMPEVFTEAFRDLLIDNDLPVWMSLFTFAVSPGICEELLFRGALMGSFSTRVSMHRAVWLSAVCFALMHFSVFRLAPTLVIGLILGYLAMLSRSVVPAMILHALYNGIMIQSGEAISERFTLGTAAMGAFALLFLSLLILLRDFRNRSAGYAASARAD